ncbi:MAG: C39 family peptidase [Deltaproteobacteria bacterium]|nr:C39 family peptidase [Deltaproteobacteria bacterium]
MKRIAVSGLLLLALAPGLRASDVQLSVGGDRMVRSVRNFKDLRREGLIVQELDYSCGAAALATLLTYFFNDRISEQEVIGFVFIHGQTPEEGLKKYFRRKGFSLLDLKRFAEFRNFKATGYKGMTLDDLQETLLNDRVPVLVPISPFGYHHFVIVKGFAGNRVFLADPAIGHTTMKISRFAESWVDGIGFVVTRKNVRIAARRPAESENELDNMTAAGTPGPARPSPAAPSSRGLLTIRPEDAVPDSQRLLNVIAQENTVFDVHRVFQTFKDGFGGNLFSLFELQKFNPVIQLGDPAGNFLDFSPPPGQGIHTGQ